MTAKSPRTIARHASVASGMPVASQLTPRQRQILDWIRSYLETKLPKGRDSAEQKRIHAENADRA